MAYPGNKSIVSLYPNIINEFPPHSMYWELFAGSAQILRKKKPAQFSAVVDINPSLVQAVNNPYPASVVVINHCAISLLKQLTVLGHESLIYMDPPYIISERNCKKAIYKNELTPNQHAEMLSHVLKLSCRVVISHFDSCFYDDFLIGWRKKVVKVSYRGQVRSEAVYCNFPVPSQLHETTFTGANKTERQEFKRQANRWVNRFKKLTPQAKQLIIAALDRENLLTRDLAVISNYSGS